MTSSLISAPFSWYETPDDVLRRLSPAWRARPDKHVQVRRTANRHRRPRHRNYANRVIRASEEMTFEARLALQKRDEP